MSNGTFSIPASYKPGGPPPAGTPANGSGTPGYATLSQSPGAPGLSYGSGSDGNNGYSNSGTFGTNTSGKTNAPQLNPSSFQYGGTPGGANAASTALQNAGTQGLFYGSTDAPSLSNTTIDNPYNNQGQGQFNSAYNSLGNAASQYGALAGQYGNLGNFYQGMVNGTGPNLAQAQLNQATNQNVNSQFALANSGRGGLGSAAGQVTAQQNAALQGQQNAQQAVATNIQQQQLGAQGLAGALSGQGSAIGGMGNIYQAQGGLAGSQENFNQNAAENQANLNYQTGLQNANLTQGQDQLNNQFYLGTQGLANNIQNQQLQAGIAQNQLNSSNLLAAQNANQQNAQFNAGQNQNMLGQVGNFAGGLLSGGASLLGFDMDLGGRGRTYHDADLIEPNKPIQDSAHWTLREEPGFILAINQMTGELSKLKTEPLTASERKQAVNRPHGAGPLGSDDPRRLRMYADADLDGGGFSATDDPFAGNNPITQDTQTGPNSLAPFQSAAVQAQNGNAPSLTIAQKLRQSLGMPANGYGQQLQGSGLAAFGLQPQGQNGALPLMQSQPPPQKGGGGGGGAGGLSALMKFAPLLLAADLDLTGADKGGDWGDRTYTKPSPPNVRQFPGQTQVHHYTDTSAIRPNTAAEGYAALHRDAYPTVYHDLDLTGRGRGRVYHDAGIGPAPSPFLDPNWNQGVAPLGIGDEGSAQALAAAQQLQKPPPPPAPTYDPSVVNALAAAGKYSGPGITGGAPSVPPALAAQVAAAPSPAGAPVPEKPVVTFKPKADASAQGTASGSAPMFMGPSTIGARVTPTIDPTLLDSIKRAGANEIDASQDLGRAEQQKVEDAGIAHMLRGKTLADQAADVTSRANANDTEIRGIEDHIRALSDDYANNRGVDQDRWWHNQSTGNQIRYGIASLFGGIGGALQHTGRNTAVEAIQGKINNDLEDQKAAIERKRGHIADMQGLLASAYRRTGNMDQAMAVARGLALNQVDEEQQAYAAGSNSASALAQARINTAHIQTEVAKTIASGEKYTPAQTVGGFNPAQAHAEFVKYAKSLAEKGDLNIMPERTWIAQTYGGMGGAAGTPKNIPNTGKKSPGEMLNEAQSQVAAVRRAPNSSWAAGNVGNAVTRGLGLQGTEGQDADIAQGSYNTSMKLNLHQWGVRLADPEKAQEFIAQWEIKPNDTPSTIDKKTSAYLQFMQNQGANTAGPTGTDPGAMLQ